MLHAAAINALYLHDQAHVHIGYQIAQKIVLLTEMFNRLQTGFIFNCQAYKLVHMRDVIT